MSLEQSLRNVKAGEQLSASQWNLMIQLMKEVINDMGPEAFNSSSGHHKRPSSIRVPLIRAVLDEDFIECGTANATIQSIGDDDQLVGLDRGILLIDPAGVIPGHLLAQYLDGVFVVPKGFSVWCVRMPDLEGRRLCEPLQFGQPCKGGGSEEGSEGSEGSQEGSEGSGSQEGSEGSEAGSPPCITEQILFNGITLPIIHDPEFILGKDMDGCVGWVRVSHCKTGSA